MKKIMLIAALTSPVFVKAQLVDSAQRLVHVQGGLNFRDVGGYKTKDGKEVAWGKVYRSAAINRLSDSDLKLMDAQKIYTVIDFRGTAEAAAAPDRLNPGVNYTLCPAGSENVNSSSEEMIKMLKTGDNMLTKFYGEEGVKYAGDRFRAMFVKLLTVPEDEAILYHCTGGRDRTGMATALFLYILGVPDQTIKADYLASNVYLTPMMKPMLKPLAEKVGMSEDALVKAMELKPEYIDAFFGAINKEYGSVENFLQEEMGIGAKEMAYLKQKYTH